MIEFLAKWVVRRSVAWLIVLTTLTLSVMFMSMAARVPHDDDLLAFLPKDNEAIGTFYDVNKRFGGLDTALVGFESDDIFQPDFLKSLRRVTNRLDEMPDLRVLSLMNLEDFSPDPMGGIKAGLLVPTIPKGANAHAALRRDVLARDHVVGNIVSQDGTAALLIATLADGADPRDVATRIRGVVDHEMPTVKAFYGGTPFVSSYIYDTTQEDMRRLTPWAVLAIVLIMLLAFRDFIGTGLALLSTGIGIILAIGTMDLVGASFNIVLGGMPVILFAVGSAYGIHILARYYTHARIHDSEAALTITLVQTGPTVIAAGLTTVAGLLSFLCMDIEPLRTFGMFTALGIFATLVLSLTFIPAVISLTGLKARPSGPSMWQSLLERCVAAVVLHRKPALILLAVITVCGLYYTGKVDSSMDPKAFYEVDSAPDQAERFLGRHFGGSQFAQLHIEGDMKDPHLLRAVQGLVDRLNMFDEIQGTAHIGQVIARANEGFEDASRIPDTAGKVATIYGFLEGQSAIRQLISDDRKEALVQLKIASRDPHILHDVLERIEAEVAAEFGERWHYEEVSTTEGPQAKEARQRQVELVARRVNTILHEGGVGGNEVSVERLVGIVGKVSADASPTSVEEALTHYLKSEESVVDLPQAEGQGDPARKVAKAVALLGPSPDGDKLLETVAALFDKPVTDEWVDDLAFSLETRIAETWRDAQAATRVEGTLERLGLKLPQDERMKKVRKSLASGMMALDASTVALRANANTADARSVAVQVTGLPVLHRGLSQSVTQNQFKSLAFALILVFIIMMGVYRSVWSGLLATGPTALTLLVIYGAMGLFGVRLDIGTSMLASLIIGAGVDYGVHLLDAWHVDSEEALVDGATHAAAHTGPAIWTNALAVCAGFFVLTLGDARPLQNVGGLTAAAMLTAAIATFVVIPALARKREYVSRRVVELVGNPADAMDDAMSTALRSAAPD